MYHGTHVDFNPGDIIKPGSQLPDRPVNYGVNPAYGDEVGTHAFATNDLEEAAWFAQESAGNHGGDPKVYEVEPVGKVTTRPLYDPENEDLPEEARSVMEHLSEEGFKVVKRHGG